MLYLVFNEGYASSTGDELHRVELSGEAIRLTRMVHRMLPDDGEVAGLLAHMVLTDARRPARTDAMVHGPAEGLQLLEGLDERPPGHYRLDAVRAHFHEMAGDLEMAVTHYRAAAGRTTSRPEQRYLTTRAARLKAKLDAPRR